MHTRDADDWFVPQFAIYPTCHGICHGIYRAHVTVDVICLVPASCLCHNGDYPGTYARSCLTVDELLVGHCV